MSFFPEFKFFQVFFFKPIPFFSLLGREISSQLVRECLPPFRARPTESEEKCVICQDDINIDAQFPAYVMCDRNGPTTHDAQTSATFCRDSPIIGKRHMCPNIEGAVTFTCVPLGACTI